MAKISGIHIPAEPRNLAINGATDFFQRNEGNAVNVNTATTTIAYYADMVKFNLQGTTVKNMSFQRSPTIPSQAQSGFQGTFSTAAVVNTGFSLAAGDLVFPWQYSMEGLDYEKIHNKTVTFGFWIYATVPGTYNFSLANSASTRTYVTTFSVAGALTWQYVPITVQMDSVPTGWNFDNTIGLQVFIGQVAGSTFQTSTLGSWTGNTVYASTTQTNWAATTGAVVQITQFSIVEGPLGFSATGFQRQGSSIQQELALCQRYYGKTFPIGTAPVQASGDQGNALQSNISSAAGFFSSVTWSLPVTMRATPTVITYNPTQANASFRNQTNTADSAVNGGIFTSTRSVYINSQNTFAANTWGQIHASADAGL